MSASTAAPAATQNTNTVRVPIGDDTYEMPASLDVIVGGAKVTLVGVETKWKDENGKALLDQSGNARKPSFRYEAAAEFPRTKSPADAIGGAVVEHNGQASTPGPLHVSQPTKNADGTLRSGTGGNFTRAYTQALTLGSKVNSDGTLEPDSGLRYSLKTNLTAVDRKKDGQVVREVVTCYSDAQRRGGNVGGRPFTQVGQVSGDAAF